MGERWTDDDEVALRRLLERDGIELRSPPPHEGSAQERAAEWARQQPGVAEGVAGWLVVVSIPLSILVTVLTKDWRDGLCTILGGIVVACLIAGTALTLRSRKSRRRRG